MKTIWIVSGGIEAVPGIQRAKEMGLHVVVSDMNPHAPGFAIADDTIIANTYDVDATVEKAREYHHKVRSIDGVICMAADVPLTVASVASALGLPGISIETARLSADKLAMKKCFAESAIPIPWFSPVESYDHLVSLVKEKDYPLVLKPVDSRGARGVLKLDSRVDLKWAFRHSLEFSPSSRVMVEEFLQGPQISTESFIVDDHAYTPGFTDRNYEFLERFTPYMIENGGQQPSILDRQKQEAVAHMAEDAGKALGIVNGICKGDMVLTSEGPKVIEIAARLSGGWFSTDQIPLATGVDFLGIALRIALGEEVPEADMIPRYQKGVAIRYFFPEPGRVVEILNADRFNNVSWVHKLGFFVKTGDVIEPVTNHTKRAGFVITEGKDRQEAVSRAIEVIKTVQIETVPI